MPANTDFDYPGLNIKRGTSALVTQVQLKGSTSGLLTVKSPAVTGTNTITLPAGTTDFSATGGANQVLKQLSVGGAVTVAQLAFTELSGSIATGQVSGSYTGITGVGTLTVGTWNATTIAVLNGGTGVTVRGATYQAQPADPTGTTSLTGVMMGLAGSITPKTTGTIVFKISGVGSVVTLGDTYLVQGRYGTGTAPTNGAAVTGTGFSSQVGATIGVANGSDSFCCEGLITGLSVGTVYWIDAALQNGGGASTKSILRLSITAFELTV